MKLNTIYQHNVLNTPWPVGSESVDCIVTSPPYWGLRDYGVDGQIGLEDTPEEFVANMVDVFEEARRILKPEGTLWLNLGDSYAHNGAAYGNAKSTLTGRKHGEEMGKAKRFVKKAADLKPKDLVGIPWMVAFALRAAGWYLRQDIIWSKPNPMPESATDRCTKSHEYIFLLSKSHQYFFDALSISTPYADKTLTTFGIESKGYGDGSGLVQSENWAASIKTRKPKVWKQDGRKPRPGIDIAGGNQADGGIPTDTERGRANKRSVWTVSGRSFKDAHFATFPPDLIVDCIKAGCPVGGVVLDPFMGAGTTALVARKLGRNFIGLELNPDYIKIADKRLKKELGMFL